jgi:Cu+-exporting ATPase
MVYELLNENNLCEYYSYADAPGASQRFVADEAYSYLDEPSIRKKLLTFDSEAFTTVQFFIPAIHCISCIWLLENLQRIKSGILKSEVNFSRKQVTISFNPAVLSLSALATLLASVGYAPSIRLEKQERPPIDSSLVIKLAIAGFCFGNIMLLSFPEYLGLDGSDPVLKAMFSYLNVALAIPIVAYSAQDYVVNAWKCFRQKQINIDVPIAVGLATLFLRSTYDIFSQTGPGYLDSLSGLVFFLLIGRWFQSKTYDSLAFDRDYKSYFPLAVQKWTGVDWQPVIVYKLNVGDRIRVRNREIIPSDSLLVSDQAYVDYSFVTGESKPVKAKKNDLIYAGGRLLGQLAEKIAEGHLTSLWNDAIFQKKTQESGHKKIIDRAARVFTWAVMALALVTAAYWYFFNPSQMWLVLTSVLMVACPCALALAAPFTYGNMLRVFGHHGFYLKNADVIERLAQIDAVVFDKTGTITQGASDVKFIGVLEEEELGWIKVLTSSSLHPLSKLIARSIKNSATYQVEAFQEYAGKGVEAIVDGHSLKVGSPSYVGVFGEWNTLATRVFVSVDQEIRGYFQLETTIRSNIKELVLSLGQKCVALLSGDQASEERRMREIFPTAVQLKFEQSPRDKMEYISALQKQGKHVAMLGDGLNDSGALKQSHVGIAVTDDTGIFTPACDGILRGSKIAQLNFFLNLSKSATRILKVGFGISFFYNITALSFAVTGNLSPLVAAILMPISSVSVVGFSTLAVNWVSRGLGTSKNI